MLVVPLVLPDAVVFVLARSSLVGPVLVVAELEEDVEDVVHLVLVQVLVQQLAIAALVARAQPPFLVVLDHILPAVSVVCQLQIEVPWSNL